MTNFNGQTQAFTWLLDTDKILVLVFWISSLIPLFILGLCECYILYIIYYMI